MKPPAGGEAHLAQPGGELLVAGDDSAHHVPVAPQVLRRAVQHDPRPVFDGPLEYGGGEGVVDQQRHRAAGVRDRPDVHFREGRVGRRLDDHQSRVGADRLGDARRVRPGHLRAEEPGTQKVVAAAVERADRDHMAQPHARAGQQDSGECGHAARERHSARGPFEAGQSRLETGGGRIVEPCVDRGTVEPGAGGGEGVDPFRLAPGVVTGIGGGQVDRRGVQAEGCEVFASGMHGFGGRRPVPGCRRGRRRGVDVHAPTLNSHRVRHVIPRATFGE